MHRDAVQQSPAVSQKKRMLGFLLSWRGFMLMVVLLVGALLFGKQSRSQSEWELYQKEFIASGEHLDWEYFIPPKIPEAENFYAAPGMKQIFQRMRNPDVIPATNNLVLWNLPPQGNWSELKGKEEFISSPNGYSYPTSIVLNWEKTNRVFLDLFYDACQRPKARLLGSYNRPFYDLPNFVGMRVAAQSLATLARAHLVNEEPDKALRDLAGIERLIDCLENGPTLVEAMIRVALIGLYVESVRFGFEKNAWEDEQLVALQKPLLKFRCLPGVAHSLKAEVAQVVRSAETLPFDELRGGGPVRFSWDWKGIGNYFESIIQRVRFASARERNLLTYTRLMQMSFKVFDAKGERYYPKESTAQTARFSSLSNSAGNILSLIAIPNFVKAYETAAKNQTQADQAMLVCALELFRRKEQHYPETLEELVPQYIATLPIDVLSGNIYQYRRKGLNDFVLYGVGVDETDDGGAASDWVWGK